MGKRKRLQEILDRLRPALIDAATAARLKQELDPVSESYFRRLLRDTGVPLDPMVEGIRQDSLAAFERTFLALIRCAASDDLKRREVIRSRDHARLAARRQPSEDREEMILWMTVWLENASIFDDWLRLRKATGARSNLPG